MRTFGSKYIGPRRNWMDYCDYCGDKHYRSNLVLDAEKQLRCPTCQRIEGKTILELAQESAAAVMEVKPVRGKTREY